jgi:signal transduction histidine kinase
MAAIGRFAGTIAHEINNPLEAMTNIFYLLLNHASLGSEAVEIVRLAEQELLRISHITKQTLSFYRETQSPVSVSLPEILDEILALQSSGLHRPGIIVQKKYSSEGTVIGFPGELRQVFLNLIANAIQAMPNGGRLRVRVAHCKSNPWSPRGLRVSICDTGGGIDPEHSKRLFEPFFTTKSMKGTGLGLWISKGIVEKHEGTIRFRSICAAKHHATCFSVFLPASFAYPQSAMRLGPSVGAVAHRSR